MSLNRETDKLLTQIKEVRTSLSQVEDEAQKEIEKIQNRYDKIISPLKAQLEELEKKLIEMCKKNKNEMFAESEVVELKNGVLIYNHEWKVKRARGVLKRLEELGIDEAIKISKSVKWDLLESWPDDKLILVGTKRKLKETFSYEIK